jgi:uncharacterized PurR-regulated membrane protein YhhQ (DUF165 family)
VAYIASIVLANVLTQHFGLIPIGFGLLVTAGTFAAGATLLARNIGQDIIGRIAIVCLMLIGVILSWWLASPALAIASGVAFALSETTDMAIYTPLRKHGWSRAALAAAFVGAIVDTIAFLWIAGFPVTTGSVLGQVAVKFGMSAIAVAMLGVSPWSTSATRARREFVTR